MIVLSYGMTKSGSTLSFELCRALLELRGYRQRRLPDTVVKAGHLLNFTGNPSIDQLEQMQRELAPGEAIAIKLHGWLQAESRAYIESAIFEDRVRVHVSYRDPREVCLSLVDAGAAIRQREPGATRGFSQVQTLDDSLLYANRQLRQCKNWISVRGALPLYYNDVAFDPDQTIVRLCENLGLSGLSSDEARVVKDAVYNHGYTLKNRAVPDRHRQDLTAEQDQYLLDRLPQSREFIARACLQRDYRWMAEVWATAP